MEWDFSAIQKLLNAKTDKELLETFPGLPLRSLKRRRREFIREFEVLTLPKQIASRTPKQLQMIVNKQKIENLKPLRKYFKGSLFKFGVIGDTHLGSKEERLKELATFYRICKKENIKDVFHCGDLLDGQNVYRGHHFEVKIFGCDNQIEHAVKNYPKEEDITTHFILGNHDCSFFKESGIDIGWILAERRKDLNYLGQYQADVYLNGVLIRLLHPDSGVSYALSYKSQRIIDNMQSGKKPNIFLIGHYHTLIYYFHRNVHAFNVASFQAQNSYLIRKGINSTIGGWIVQVKKIQEAHRDSIIEIVPRFIPFYV